MINLFSSLRPTQKKFFQWVLIGALVLFFFNDCVLAYDNFFLQSPIIGLKLAGESMTGKSQAEIRVFIAQRFKQIGPLHLTYQNKTITIRPAELGLRLNPSEVMADVIKEGRQGGWFQKFLLQEKAVLGLIDVPMQGWMQPTLVTVKILQIQDAVDTDPLPLRPDFTGDLNRTLPPVDGVKVDVNRLSSLIYHSMNLPGEKTAVIPLKTAQTHQQYTEEDVIPIREQAKSILSQPSAGLVAAGLTFSLTPNDLRHMFMVAERPDNKNPKKFVLSLRLNEKMLNRKLGDFAALVESKNHAEFSYQYARVALYAQVFSGKPGPISLGTTLASLPFTNVLGVASSSGQKVVYLTFDDGPDPTYHPLIVDILKAFGIKATFFLIGRNAQKYPSLVEKTLDGGNTINNHSLSHPFLPNLSSVSIQSELAETDAILQPMNKNQPIRLFRPPFGGTNRLIQSDATILGMSQVLWTVDPRDWSEPETNDLVQRVISHTVNGSIVLMHSNHLATVRALPQIIQSLEAEGFVFGLL